MPNLKVNREELRILAEQYNTQGKQAICELLQSKYEIKVPNTVIKRMKSVESFHYDSSSDQFLFHPSTSPDAVFLSMEELCTPMMQEQPLTKAHTTVNDSKPQAMEKLIQELIGDRLLAISKYVVMDSLSRKVIVEKTALTSDGYEVVLH